MESYPQNMPMELLFSFQVIQVNDIDGVERKKLILICNLV